MPCRGPDALEFVDSKTVAKLKGKLALGELDGHEIESILWMIDDIANKYYVDRNREDAKLTPWLCGILRQMEEQQGPGLDLNPELETWWETHKRRDERRKKLQEETRQENIIRKQALDKLTEEEKKALRIKGV